MNGINLIKVTTYELHKICTKRNGNGYKRGI